jgi:signal transduction histidine kinase
LERQGHLEAMRQREEELFQAQKMEAMGRLAGGVAHDFNNLLTAIGGYAELLLAGLEDEGQRADCQEILRASERAAELTRQLLSFSRREELRPGRLDLDRVIGETERLLRRVIPADIRLDLELAGDLPEVLADAGRLEQVLVNLVVNARDAMQGRGRITISTGLREPDEAAGAEAWVCLTVADTGPGIPPDVRDRIFEPFFTTKAAGQGTGLGLSTVYSIVQQLNGTIRLGRATGRGAVFEILLPPAADAWMPPRDDSGSGEFALTGVSPS